MGFDIKVPKGVQRKDPSQSSSFPPGMSTAMGMMFGAKMAGEKSAAIKTATLEVENKQTRDRLISIVNDMDETMAKIPDLSPSIGRLGGMAVSGVAKTGLFQEQFPELAEVETWNGAKKAFSRIVAKAYGEQRITDLDRDDFIEIINSPESTGRERIIKSRRLKNAVIDLFGEPQEGDVTFAQPFERRVQPRVGQSPIPGSPGFQTKDDNNDPLGIFS